MSEFQPYLCSSISSLPPPSRHQFNDFFVISAPLTFSSPPPPSTLTFYPNSIFTFHEVIHSANPPFPIGLPPLSKNNFFSLSPGRAPLQSPYQRSTLSLSPLAVTYIKTPYIEFLPGSCFLFFPPLRPGSTYVYDTKILLNLSSLYLEG